MVSMDRFGKYSHIIGKITMCRFQTLKKHSHYLFSSCNNQQFCTELFTCKYSYTCVQQLNLNHLQKKQKTDDLSK